ncbi:MAG: DUF2884 family protein [Enterobacterales bacterium]|nr:DUF2884 family protein [Enterobacterales bacterium]
MNKIILLLVGLLASPLAMAHSDRCDFSIDYNLEISDQKLVFNSQESGKVEFYTDRLIVDGQTLILTPQQLKASQEFDRLARQMVPKVVDIAIDAAELGVKAATIVVSSLFEDDPQAIEDLVKPISDFADKIRNDITEQRINTQSLNTTLDHQLEQEIEQLVEKAFSKYAGKIIGQVFDAAFSTEDDSKSPFSQRMDKMQHNLDKYIEAESEAIENEGKALCSDLKRLEKLDQVLELNKGYPSTGLIRQGVHH